jgi:hypothetical protein
VVLLSLVIIHKVKATIQQAQNKRLPTELLKSNTMNKIFEFGVKSAGERGLEPLIKNSLWPISSGSVILLQAC